MKCPKSFHYRVDAEGVVFRDAADCLREECAWWDKFNNTCNEVSKTAALDQLDNVLRDIREALKK